jgi:four helix bundle protein
VQTLPKVAVGAETANSLQMAMGSASELENHLLLARDLRFLNEEHHSQIEVKVIEVKKMLASLIRKVDAERHP